MNLNIASNISDILRKIVIERTGGGNDEGNDMDGDRVSEQCLVENAIWGVGKLCLFQARGIDFEGCLLFFVSMLPRVVERFVGVV